MHASAYIYMLLYNLTIAAFRIIVFCKSFILKYTHIIKRLVTHSKWLKRKMPYENLPPHRNDPVIKILDTPVFKSIFTQELSTLADLFKKNNYELRIAGGAVRDILMNINPKDLDFATTATPDQMKELFNKEEIRMFNVNGEKHGTVTCRINDKENFEITTLRIDVVTDGRHADVLFTTDWLLDASRRDLTINSMFLDLDGKIYDYFYGYDDLMKRRIAFVGDPADRICEDFLRIFRYFRFYGRIADDPDNHDEQIIKAIKENISGLERISGERIWSEWSKILTGNFHRELTKKIIECGCGQYMNLPKNPNLEHFDEVCLRAQKNNVKLRPISFVAALLETEEDVMVLLKRLKFNNFDRNLALFIVQHREDKLCENPLQPYQKLVLKTIYKVSDMREYICELLKYKGALHLLNEFEKWDSKFPITSATLKLYLKDNLNLMGPTFSKLKDIWVENNCAISVEKLESYIPDIVEESKFIVKEKKERMQELRKRATKKSVQK